MTEQATLPGVSGAVGLTNHPLRGHLLTVDGRPARREQGSYQLPGADGRPIAAQLKGRLFSVHPVVKIHGHDYSTGEPTAPYLVLIAFLPLLLLLGGGPVPGVLAVLAVLFNLWVLRFHRGDAWKSLLIFGTLIAAVLFTVFWAFFAPWFVGLFQR